MIGAYGETPLLRANKDPVLNLPPSSPNVGRHLIFPVRSGLCHHVRGRSGPVRDSIADFRVSLHYREDLCDIHRPARLPINRVLQVDLLCPPVQCQPLNDCNATEVTIDSQNSPHWTIFLEFNRVDNVDDGSATRQNDVLIVSAALLGRGDLDSFTNGSVQFFVEYLDPSGRPVNRDPVIL